MMDTQTAAPPVVQRAQVLACPNRHQMVLRSAAPASYFNGRVICDVCSVDVDVAQGFHHCGYCGYDLCDACAATITPVRAMSLLDALKGALLPGRFFTPARTSFHLTRSARCLHALWAIDGWPTDNRGQMLHPSKHLRRLVSECTFGSIDVLWFFVRYCGADVRSIDRTGFYRVEDESSCRIVQWLLEAGKYAAVAAPRLVWSANVPHAHTRCAPSSHAGETAVLCQNFGVEVAQQRYPVWLSSAVVDAVKAGSLRTLQLLLEAGGDVEDRIDAPRYHDSGVTPMMVVAAECYNNIVQVMHLLMEYCPEVPRGHPRRKTAGVAATPPDPNELWRRRLLYQRSDKGLDPMAFAIDHDNVDAILALMACGVDVSEHLMGELRLRWPRVFGSQQRGVGRNVMRGRRGWKK